MKLRIALLVLLLANLVFHVWSAGYLGETTDGREPLRLEKQLEPQKIIIRPPRLDLTLACRQVGPLSAERLAELREWVDARSGIKLELNTTDDTVKQWVIIPALASVAQAEKKQTELRALGISDSTIMNDSEFGPVVVSIANFTEVGRARKYFEDLNGKGVRSARLVERRQSAASSTAQIRIPESEFALRIAELNSWLTERSAEAPRNCPAP